MLNIIRKIQVKTTVRYYILFVKVAIKKTQQITNVGKEKKKTLSDGNANQCSHYGRVWLFPKYLNIELLYDLAVSFLSIYSKKYKH